MHGQDDRPNKKIIKIKNYSTEYSHVVPHHSTDSAINCLTAQIGRDAVGLVVYGRNSKDIKLTWSFIVVIWDDHLSTHHAIMPSWTHVKKIGSYPYDLRTYVRQVT